MSTYEYISDLKYFKLERLYLDSDCNYEWTFQTFFTEYSRIHVMCNMTDKK